MIFSGRLGCQVLAPKMEARGCSDTARPHRISRIGDILSRRSSLSGYEDLLEKA